MREIKLRIWDIEDKRWTVYEDVAWLQMVGRNRLKLKTKKGIACQYTGLKDKKGKEIYEGDIVRHAEELSEVVFERGCFKLPGFCIDEYTSDLEVVIYDWRGIEVIGNIYESSELLK